MLVIGPNFDCPQTKTKLVTNPTQRHNTFANAGEVRRCPLTMGLFVLQRYISRLVLIRRPDVRFSNYFHEDLFFFDQLTIIWFEFNTGLTLGLLSLDPMNLKILSKTGTPSERKYASRISLFLHPIFVKKINHFPFKKSQQDLF